MEDVRVRPLFIRALEMEPEKRAAFLEATDVPPEVRDAVLILLQYDSGSETFFDNAISRERTPALRGEDSVHTSFAH